MAERQYAVQKIRKLNAEDLKVALHKYAISDDIIVIFENKGTNGEQLLNLKDADILQWRRSMSIAQFNKIRNVIQTIQENPEDFIAKALNITYNKTQSNIITRNISDRKPLPQPRPDISLTIPVQEIGTQKIRKQTPLVSGDVLPTISRHTSYDLPHPPSTFPKCDYREDTEDDSFSDSDMEQKGPYEDSNICLNVRKQEQKNVTLENQPERYMTPLAGITIKEGAVLSSETGNLEIQAITPRKGIYGRSPVNINRPLPSTPTEETEKLPSAHTEEVTPKYKPKMEDLLLKPKPVPLPNTSFRYLEQNSSPNKINEDYQNLAGFKNVTSREAENILKTCENGTYLLRPSTTFYCTLVVKHADYIFNVGISYEPLEKVFKCSSNPSESLSFTTVSELLHYFTINPLYLKKRNANSEINKVFLIRPLPNL